MKDTWEKLREERIAREQRRLELEQKHKQEGEDPNNTVKRLGMTTAFALGGAALTGTWAAAGAGAAVYGLWRGMVYCWKKQGYVGESEGLSLRMRSCWLALGAVLIGCEVGDFHHSIARIHNSRDHAQTRLMMMAADEMLKGNNGPIEKCEGVYAFRPFGQRGEKVGDECVTFKLEQRDGLNFMARVKYQSEPKEELKAFRPDRWALWALFPFVSSNGYENSRGIEKPPVP